jgi:hypothetical protein
VPFKGYLSIVNKEDVLNYLSTCPLTAIVNSVLILNLNIKVLVFKIFGNYYNLLLLSKSPSFPFCLARKVIVILFKKDRKAFFLKQF